MPLKRSAQFDGRASRREYWLFQLFMVLLYIPFIVLITICALAEAPGAMMAFAALTGLVALGLFVPTLAVTVHRLHDVNQSGWMYLLALAPFGGLVVLVFTLLPSTPGDNRFGAPAPRP
ncbi:MAG: Inner membrane protein YhaH [Stenotrophomonas maltophilia]|uniref:Inner membrane protein YhaH n=1 Tax=Stenotrophomonas maltophilia TaxID=40324 RepID=A0A7V8JN72_STEMA|nr:MAG: Inner membrane protein YhaH [Stenotrophomonas maltophilia]